MEQTLFKNVVFTGPAVDKLGNRILRENLKAMAEERGFVVMAAVTPKTDMLIASRTDTVKARKAEDAGLAVLDYPQFLALLNKARKIASTEKSGGTPDPWVDGVGHTLSLLKGPGKMLPKDHPNVL